VVSITVDDVLKFGLSCQFSGSGSKQLELVEVSRLFLLWHWNEGR